MVKISELPAGNPVSGGDVLPIDQGGVTRQVTVTELAAAIAPPSISFLPQFLTAGGALTVQTTPGIVTFNGTPSIATTATLPALADILTAGTRGQLYIYKDGTGMAGSYPITLVTPDGALIDGQASVTIFTNYDRITLSPKPAYNSWGIVG